ncbi:hypothetical protein AB0I89_10200 [Micromonospora sp. NPDC049801]|uniref:hypothetical protein n=2 Tax=unclassified Micromonospora TaxID=2617518 RepID=UPI0033D610AE
MTDRDVISDAHQMTGVGTVNAYTPRNRAHKPSWYWTVNAHHHTAWLVAELAPLLGHRRRSAAIGLWSAGGQPVDTFPARRELTLAEGIPWVAGIVEGEGCISVSARAGETVIYIANDSAVPIVDITFHAFYQEAFWSSRISGGMRWSAIGWLARGPAIVHPSQTLALKLKHLRMHGVEEPIKGLPELTLLHMRYEARAEARRVASFRRVKKAPTKLRMIGVGGLERCDGQYLKSG